MIICSCNVLSDQDVRSAVEAERTRWISQVYGCLGSPKCGRCVRAIRRLVDEALEERVRHLATAARGPPNRDSAAAGRLSEMTTACWDKIEPRRTHEFEQLLERQGVAG
ncbi:(2Fe-2S)-binding protein [Mesorhizobium sp. M1340]|uniref:(2Fe-2S)-binding protein n=1 Tax=unclassified Mesorhizobium TaxID=325217 RepID=UPI003335E075